MKISSRFSMYVILLVILTALVLPVSVWGRPFLICDAQTNVDDYVIYSVAGTTCTAGDIAGKTPVTTPYPLHYDLEGIPTGAFHYCIAAENVWGQSILVPFGSTKAVPGSPANTRLSNQ